MAKVERENQENKKNPYELTKEESRYPGGGGRDWLDPIVARQREGIDQGVRPKKPRGLPKYLDKIWRGKVWRYYLLSKFSPEERRIIRWT